MNVPLLFAALLTGSFEAFMQGMAGAPPADAVTAPASVENYLHLTRGLATWHIDLLIRRGGVSVTRNGSPVTSVRWDTQLAIGDVVTLDETGQGYDTAYRGVAAKTYAMVAQHDIDDNHLNNVAAILARRGAVDLSVFDPVETRVTTLAEFTRHVADDHRVTGPALDLVIGSHANWSGQLSLLPDINLGDVATNFESINPASDALRVSDDAFLPRPGSDPGRRIIFLGCDAGNALPLLRKLRQALNVNTPVLAPMHWFGTTVNEFGDYIEYMAQAHFMVVPGALTRDQLIDAYKGLHAVDLDGADIDPAFWEAWVTPMDGVPSGYWIEEQDNRIRLPAVSWPGDSVAAAPFTIRKGIRLTHQVVQFPDFEAPTTLTQAQFDADPIRALKDAINARPLNSSDPFSRTHPFPWWERFRFKPPRTLTPAQVQATVERWVDAFQMVVLRQVDGSNRASITAAGQADLYELTVPIINAAGELYSNFYPAVAGAPQPVEPRGLPYNDPRFWGAG